MTQGGYLLSSTRLPLPEYSVSVDIGKGVPGQDTGATSSSHNKIVFSGLTAIDAGETKKINLVYELPSSILKHEGESIVYELLIQKQPGVRQRRVSVDFLLPDGYSLDVSSIPPSQAKDSQVSFTFELTQDTLLSVEFTYESNASGYADSRRDESG